MLATQSADHPTSAAGQLSSALTITPFSAAMSTGKKGQRVIYHQGNHPATNFHLQNHAR